MSNRLSKLFRSKSSKTGSPNLSPSSTGNFGEQAGVSRSKSTSKETNPYRNPSPATRRPGNLEIPVPSDPPPAYEGHANDAPASSALLSSMQTSASPSHLTPNTAGSRPTSPSPSDDGRYDFLKSFDTIILIDDSGSMAGRSWNEVQNVLEQIVPICVKYDKDGIDIKFLNESQADESNVTNPSSVRRIFQTVRPRKGTPTGQRLNSILKDHLKSLMRAPEQTKPINIIVITDGVPSDDVETPIISAAKKLDKLDADPWQIGIQFFQVGDEIGATEHLEGLDDDLEKVGNGCRDIVDTVPYKGKKLSADGILKVVLGAVNRRLDRQANSHVNLVGGR